MEFSPYVAYSSLTPYYMFHFRRLPTSTNRLLLELQTKLTSLQTDVTFSQDEMKDILSDTCGWWETGFIKPLKRGFAIWNKTALECGMYNKSFDLETHACCVNTKKNYKEMLVRFAMDKMTVTFVTEGNVYICFSEAFFGTDPFPNTNKEKAWENILAFYPKAKSIKSFLESGGVDIEELPERFEPEDFTR